MNKLLGTRLRRAREEIGLSQGAFAKALDLSSEYISLLESGKRTPSFETLVKVAAFLNKEISYFFEERRPGLDGLAAAAASLDERTRKDVLRFRTLCERYLQLEEMTGRRLDLAPLYAHLSPERLAEEERRRLDLGSEPVRDIFGLCEINGCRVIRQPFPEETRISGIFVYDEERKAAFAGVNANEPAALQVVIAAHEYAHYLKDRGEGPIIDGPDVVTEEYVSLYAPREQFAQAFAGLFLVPPAKLRELIEKDVRARNLGFDDILFLKRYFGVGTRTMLRSLRSMGYLAEPKFEEFFRKNPEDRETEVFGTSSGQEERRGRTLFRRAKARAVLSDRYRLLAAEGGAAAGPKTAKASAAAKPGGSRESKS